MSEKEQRKGRLLARFENVVLLSHKEFPPGNCENVLIFSSTAGYESTLLERDDVCITVSVHEMKNDAQALYELLRARIKNTADIVIEKRQDWYNITATDVDDRDITIDHQVSYNTVEEMTQGIGEDSEIALDSLVDWLVSRLGQRRYEKMSIFDD